MGYSRLLHFLDSNIEMTTPDTGDGTRWATQEDIAAILG